MQDPKDSPLASPRSSTSSTDVYPFNANSPLTPMGDPGLEKQVEGLLISHEAEGDGEEGKMGVAMTPEQKRSSPRPKFTPTTQAYRARAPADQFAAFSFGSDKPPILGPVISTSTSPPPSPTRPTTTIRSSPSPHSPPLASFSFGTCPSIPLLNTPTAELGAFEYPEQVEEHAAPYTTSSARMRHSSSATSTSSASSSSSYRSSQRGSTSRVPLALGESHRRNSIISRPALSHPSSSASGHTIPTSCPSPPQTRRSSTTSTITTLPAAGRRPSILHSTTTEAGEGMVLASVPAPPPPSYPYVDYTHAGISPSSPNPSSSSRRSSILFHPKHMPQPVPPSLLARRGSLPVSALDPATLAQSSPNGKRKWTRSSLTAGSGYGGPGQLTAHALYNRRESVLSEGSTGSGGTVRQGEEGVARRSSLRERPEERKGLGLAMTGSQGGSGIEDMRALGAGGRRASMPAHHALSATRRLSQVPGPDPSQPHYTSPTSPLAAAHHTLTSPSPRSRRDRDTGSFSDILSLTPGRRTWTPRPSLTGRSLSSSDESEEMNLQVAGEYSTGSSTRKDTDPETMSFTDPWSSLSGTAAPAMQGVDKEQSGSAVSLTEKGLSERGRPALETIDSDRTEKGV